ncbi:MAG: FumA C-terminus/TtdB family hydratase beta subunit [Candidatus Omnitrophota bacterium]
MKKIVSPFKNREIEKLKAGDEILLDGYIYTARDQTHLKLVKDIARKKSPIDLKGQVIYYAGPTPTPKGKIIGSCGPTTASRMDSFTPALLKAGLKGMIGKGNRSKEVRQAIKRYKAVYFLTIAGAGAYLSKKVVEAKPIAYKELGAEAIYRLKLKDFPAIVGIDSRGRTK